MIKFKIFQISLIFIVSTTSAVPDSGDWHHVRRNSSFVTPELRTALDLGSSSCPYVSIQDKGLNVDGMLMPAQTGNSGQIIDHEKCVYVVIGDYKTFVEAGKSCNLNVRGSEYCPDCTGEHVSIHTSAQDQMIQQYVQASNDPTGPTMHYWLGLRKHCSDCTFQWEDFSPVDFVNWQDGEPNDAGDGEDCVHFYGSNGKWNDAPCDRGWYYICEIYQDLDHKTEQNGDKNWPSTGGCKEGWMLYAKGCYLVVGQTSNTHDIEQYFMKWRDANLYCNGLWPGATLGIFPNPFYNWFIASQVRKMGYQYWIGAQSTTQDSTFHWADNTRLTFTNWGPGKPDGNNDQDSILMYSHSEGSNSKKPGMWKDADGFNLHPFICSHKLDSSQTPVNWSGFCPEGWVPYDDVCFLLSMDKVTWEAAPAACQSQWPSDKQYKDFTVGLATIRDDYDNNLIASMMYNSETNYDMSFGYNQGAWIGFYGEKSSSGSIKFGWKNSDFSTAYTNWGLNEPNVDHFRVGVQTGVFMARVGKFWQSALQPTSQLPYVCKAFLAKPRPDDDRGALLPCDNDHGWYPSSTHDDKGHYCMRVFTDKKQFYEADHTCTAIHGGHLVSIHSDGKNQATYSAISASSSGSGDWYWIGLQDDTLGAWKWTDGGAAKYLNWAIDEPGPPYSDGKPRCAEFGPDGLWSVSKCSRQHPFLCQVPRPMEKCIGIPKIERQPCGYAGITMEVCMSDYRCCWDGTTSPLNCFHPQGRKTDSGMSIAGAVFLSIFIWGTILLIVVLFFMKKKGATLPCNFL